MQFIFSIQIAIRRNDTSQHLQMMNMYRLELKPYYKSYKFNL